MTVVEITPAERSSGQMDPEHVEAAVQAILADGFVALNDVVDTSHLDILLNRMLEDLKALLEREDAPFNWNAGNIQQDPPPFPPYLFRDILMNEMVITVTQAVLGRGIKNTLYTGNTALPSRERQPVHADTGHLWPRLDVAHPPVHLVINVPVVDMSAENGSTELWPGTHRDTTITAGKDIKVPADVLEKQRARVPPVQPIVKRGGVLIRDMRLWHAGMPNRTEQPRPLIAMLHVPGWLATGTPLTFPTGTEAFFQHPELRTCARYVEGSIDYIRAPSAYEYQK
jgi:Phytanoyl-CoA dioxygenase (PhyH)